MKTKGNNLYNKKSNTLPQMAISWQKFDNLTFHYGNKDLSCLHTGFTNDMVLVVEFKNQADYTQSNFNLVKPFTKQEVYATQHNPHNETLVQWLTNGAGAKSLSMTKMLMSDLFFSKIPNARHRFIVASIILQVIGDFNNTFSIKYLETWGNDGAVIHTNKS